MPEAECLRITSEILTELDIGEYEIKVNHRMLLDGMLAVCGVTDDQFKSVCTSIDKLDKTPWEEVRKELINDRKLTTENVDRIGDYVLLKGIFYFTFKKLYLFKYFSTSFIQNVTRIRHRSNYWLY